MNNHPDPKNHESDNFYKGVVLGFLVGSAFIWLFGTESGKRVRAEIEGENWLKKAKNLVAEFEGKEPPLQKEKAVASSLPNLTKRFFQKKKPQAF